MRKSTKAAMAANSKQRRLEEEQTSPSQAVAQIDAKVWQPVCQILELQAIVEEVQEDIAKGQMSNLEESDAKAYIKKQYSDCKEIAQGYPRLNGLIWFHVFEAKRLCGSYLKAVNATKKIKR